jgi:penicillin-binding protein 1A
MTRRGGRDRKKRRAELARGRRRRRLIAVAIAVPVLVLGSIAGAALVGGLWAEDYWNKLPELSSFRQRQFAENTRVYDSGGTPLGTIANAQNHFAIPLARMGKWLPKATVAIEDKRFYEHTGVDYQGIARAAIKDIESGSKREGASTLTQQLVRRVYLNDDNKTYKRKVQEMKLAVELERKESKAQILQDYMNSVFYGSNSIGVEAASRAYFGVSAARLTLAQAALIAGLPQQPTVYDPHNNRQAAIQRRNEVLDAMLAQGYITRAQWSSARAAPLRLHGFTPKIRRQQNFVSFVRNQLVHTKAVGPKKIGNGLRIYTTIDPKLQAEAKAAVKSVLHTKGDPLASVVTIDVATGKILAMYSTPIPGKPNFDSAVNGQGRQAGSTFKAITLTTAISEGIDPDTTDYVSAPFDWCNDPSQPPSCDPSKNEVHTADGGSAGVISLTKATALSDNTVFAQLAIDVGPSNIVSMAKALGVRSPLKPYPSITLGAQSVHPLDMASAYATLASGGVYHQPTGVSLVRNFSGEPIWKPGKGVRTVPQWVVGETTSVLENNMVNGLGRNARTSDGRPQAGKTGTADNYKDAWFCGYTPQLATCVWIGYNLPRPMLGVEGVGAVSGPTLPSQIWHTYMDQAVAKLPPVEFPKPPTPQYVEPPFVSQFTQHAEAVAAQQAAAEAAAAAANAAKAKQAKKDKNKGKTDGKKTKTGGGAAAGGTGGATGGGTTTGTAGN